MKTKNIAVLGSTGSIGTQTLEIIRNNKDMNVISLAARSNIRSARQLKKKNSCMLPSKGPQIIYLMKRKQKN